MKRILGGVLACVVALPAIAAAPETSPRPVLRGGEEVAAGPPVRPRSRPLEDIVARALSPEMALSTQGALVRPPVRPPSEQALQAAAPRPEGLAFLGPDASPRPWLRPGDFLQRVMAKRRERQRGAVCGDVAIQGDVVGYVPGRINGCGISEAVRIRSVSGVALSQSALMDCGTARALKTWVDNGVRPALRSRGQLVELRVAAHYACRTRNNQPGARISEHGKGRAIDISGFRMADGEVITVLNGWHARSTRRALRRIHQAACGPFGTVLGPNSDRFHQDHFHFDTARHRSGPFCR